MYKTLVASLLCASVATAAPGFGVRSSQAVTATVPRARAQQLAESELWREAYLRCAPWLTGAESRDPLLLAPPSFSSTAGLVSATASFQCGLGGAPDLGARLASAELVVAGKVIAIKPAGIREPVSEHAAGWKIATIAVGETLKGTARKAVDVYFSPSEDVAWVNRPKLVDGETGVFVIQPGTPGLQVPDRLDVQPLDRRDAIAALSSRP